MDKYPGVQKIPYDPLSAILNEFVLPTASLPAHYERDVKWALKTPYATAANRYTILTPNRLTVNIDDSGYALTAQEEIDLSAAANWDTVAGTNYTIAANRAGKDFYIYACQQPGSEPKLVLSANSTIPSGYDANTSRKIGGFHCLCLSVGTISGHTLTGFVTGDVLPASIWDLKHRPIGENPEGMVYSDAINRWVDIYLASGTGASTLSAFGGTISDTRDWMDFVDDGAAVKKRLLRDAEFQAIAAGSNEETNITGSADPVTTGGHVDTTSRRMISNIGCEDCCGVLWQWLDEQSYRCDPDGTVQAASKTATITHTASPGGNALYIKFFQDGTPYLCCNMATDTVDKIITLGTDYKIQIKHDADPATGGLQVYFDEDATQPARLLCNNTLLGKDCYVSTNNPAFALQIKHSATASTLGVAVTYDDGADERLEFTSPTAANGTLDLALISQTFNYYNLPGAKGSLYRQGTYGDVKLLAGASWYHGAHAGSRARSASVFRWYTNSFYGCRFAAEPQ